MKRKTKITAGTIIALGFMAGIAFELVRAQRISCDAARKFKYEERQKALRKQLDTCEKAANNTPACLSYVMRLNTFLIEADEEALKNIGC